jgi:hypothetical protein
VDREVIDYRGPFCSSLDTNSRHADSPDLKAPRQPVAVASELNDNKIFQYKGVFVWDYNPPRLYNPIIFELTLSSKVVRLYNLDRL